MLIRRKAYPRRGKSGTFHEVSATSYFLSGGKKVKAGQSFKQLCPDCGAEIVVSRASNGGTIVSERLKSGQMLKHPCFDRLKGKRKSSVSDNLDLFE